MFVYMLCRSIHYVDNNSFLQKNNYDRSVTRLTTVLKLHKGVLYVMSKLMN